MGEGVLAEGMRSQERRPFGAWRDDAEMIAYSSIFLSRKKPVIYSLSITDGLMRVICYQLFFMWKKGAAAIFLASDSRHVTMRLLVHLVKKAPQARKKIKTGR